MKRCSELVATAMESAEKISCEQDKVGIQKQGQECVRGLPLLSKHLQVLITSENDFSKDHCMKVSIINPSVGGGLYIYSNLSVCSLAEPACSGMGLAT